MIIQAEDFAPGTPHRALTARAWRGILGGGLTAATLDISYAFSIWGLRGVSPVRIGQSIAAGLLGREAALSGGVATALLGLTLHFLIALVMAAAYFTAATRIPLLVRRAPACGIAYGLALYGVMTYIVVPLSAIRGGGHAPTYIVITGILVHMVFVGLPIALWTRWALRRD